MATLALKPAFLLRPRASGTERGSGHRARNPSKRRAWQTALLTTSAMALSIFTVVAPILDDPRGHLAALEMTPMALVSSLSERAFEFTPMTFGPVITSEVLAIIDIEEWLEMPELAVHATPPAANTDPGSDG
jgi:hypothetical protein